MLMHSVRMMSVALLTWWVTALIQPAPVVASDRAAGQVAVGGEQVLQLRVAPAGMSLRERADAVQDRLVPILSDTRLQPRDVLAAPAGGGDWRILVAGRLLVTVTKDDAAANQTTPKKLAQSWVQHLRRVLPQLNVKPNPSLGEPASP